MKERIVFFVLGAVLATLAYFVGDINNIYAQNDTAVFDGDVVVNGSLYVKGGQFTVEHHLPGKKYNVVSIRADENGTIINQFLEIGSGKSLRKKTRLSGWSLQKDGSSLILRTDKRAFIALDDAKGIRTITSNTID